MTATQKTKPERVEPILPRSMLLKVLEDRAVPISLLQNRPYTCLQIRTFYNNTEYIGIGFSKVMWPDKWNPEEGADVAMRHALIMTLHQIREDEKAEETLPNLTSSNLTAVTIGA